MSTNLPAANLTIGDGAFGASAGAGTDVHAVLGVCSGGTANQVYSHADRTQLVSQLVGGPAVEDACYAIDVASKPVLVVPVNASVAGVCPALVKGVNTAQTDVTTSGTPKDAYSLAVLITKAGAVGVSRFRYALDGDNPIGPTWSPEIATAASYVLPGTGLTLAFGVASYVLGDVYSSTCTAPGYSASDVQNAVNALLADQRAFRFLHLVGQASTASASAGIASTLDTLMLSAEGAGRYCWSLMQAADDTDANLLTGFSSFSSRRVAVAAGFVRQRSVLTGRLDKRGLAWAAAAWAMRQPYSSDLGEVRAGRLPGVEFLLRDERVTPGLDAAGFLTGRTHVGRPGAFINNGRIMAPPGSDFSFIQYRQVMDAASDIARFQGQELLGRTIFVKPNGTIREDEAKEIEATFNAALVNGLGSNASGFTAVVDRALDMLSTKKIGIALRVGPKATIKDADINLAFMNPKLVVTT